MPPFRFNIPFFSFGSPSRLSSGTSSPSPPPTPPSSRPPFRPAGIAQPSKPATSSKAPPSLSRVKSNGAAIAASSTSRGAATSEQFEKQSNQSGSPLKKQEEKVTMKEKPSRESAKEAEEQRKKREVEKLTVEKRVSKAAQEQQKRKETEKLAMEERKKASKKDIEESSKTAQEHHKRKETEKLTVEERVSKAAQEQQKRKETEKLAMEEKKKTSRKEMEESSKMGQEQSKRKETDKLAVEEKKKAFHKDMEESSQTLRKETEKLAVEEKKKALHKGMQENPKTAQEHEKRKETEKLASQERDKTHQTVGKEDATQSKTTKHIATISESTRGSRDLPEKNRTKNHTDDNQSKAKGETTSKHRPPNEKGSSSTSRRMKEDIRDGISKLTWGKSNNDDEKSVSVFTLTGENRGATMSIGSEKDKKDDEIHIHRGYRTNPNESPNLTATESQGERRHKNPKEGDEEEARVKAYVNGNTQGINNSIVCESSVGENDPGVHMSFRFEVSKKEVINPAAEKKIETAKQKNEPRVRRRCLRGLLAESSESENPLKPRRHGCRFTCKDKDIENT